MAVEEEQAGTNKTAHKTMNGIRSLITFAPKVRALEPFISLPVPAGTQERLLRRLLENVHPGASSA